MKQYSFTFGGKTFQVDVPTGLTEAQARQIFDQQAKTGALVGLKPGDIIDAASQAAASVPGATAQFTQALSGIPGSVQGALTSPDAKAGLTSAIDQGKQVLSNITKSLSSTPVTNGMSVPEFAKQAQALVPIQGLSSVDVRAGLSQAAALIGQAPTEISNALGVGQFGFDASQLETAGLLKPGTASAFLSQGANELSSILQSPTVWTGAGGIKDLDSFLSNPAAQNLTQQNLMNSGLTAVKQLGLPIDKLDSKALAGVALNAAKSVETTLEWAKGQALSAEAKAEYDTLAKDAAFAVGVAQEKLNDALKQEEFAVPSENTVDRATLDAAVTRLFGNDKIPSFEYGSGERDEALDGQYKDLRKQWSDINDNILAAKIRSTSTAENAQANLGKANGFLAQSRALEGQLKTLQQQAAAKLNIGLAFDIGQLLAEVQATINQILYATIPWLRSLLNPNAPPATPF
jgi:hypothetical protein